jgi:FkbM family methyltransferase
MKPRMALRSRLVRTSFIARHPISPAGVGRRSADTLLALVTPLPQAAQEIAARLPRRRSAVVRRLARHFSRGGAPLVLTDAYDIRFVLHEWELDEVEELLSKSFYRPDFRAIAKLLAAGDTAVDVGANVGTHSIMMSRAVGPGGRVIAFEPVPSTAWLMRENLALNRIENVALHEAAVSEEPATVEMNVFDQRYSAWNSRGAASNDGISPVAVVEVPAVTLDDALACEGVERVAFLKIDVEGFELEALNGVRRLLSDGAVDVLSFEISQVPLQASGHDARSVFELLASFDYRSYRLDEQSDRFVGPFQDSDDYYANFYASRRELSSSSS